MKVKIKKILLNIAVTLSFVMILFLTSIGISVVFEYGTAWWGFITPLCAITVTFCHCYIVIHASKQIEEQDK